MNLATLRNLISDRFDHTPAWVAVITLFIGMGWLRAGVEKVLTADWWTGHYLTDFIDEYDGVGLSLYHSFLDVVVVPHAIGVSLVVLVMQFAVGAALLAGRHTKAALAAGMFMNLHFVAAGAVDPSVFYLLSQGAVLLWLAEHSRHRETPASLAVAGASGLGLAAIAAPSVTTLAPAEVIHDPALILVTVGMLTALGSWLCQRRRNLAPRRDPARSFDPHTHKQRQIIDVG